MGLNSESVKPQLARLRKNDLHKMLRWCRRELERRIWERDRAENLLKGPGMTNFMAGVTWALACRAALREYKGHTPVGGVKPMHGLPWTPRELLQARTYQLAKRDWDPVTAPNWEYVKSNMLADMNRKPPAEGVAHFKIPMVQVQRSVFLEDHVGH